MKDVSWKKLSKPIEITEDVMEELFGNIKSVKQLNSKYWLYKFEKIEIIAEDIGKSWIKIIKFRVLKEKRKV